MRGFFLISFGILQIFLMSCAGGNRRVPCGNGIVDLEETCDDGNRTSGDGCSRECQTEAGYICSGAPSHCVKSCGNGTIDPGEACDDGFMSATCNDDCTLSRCGDGKWNPVAGEACDDGGPSDTCNANCTRVGCGDGFVNNGEACDDAGESAACNANCTLASCGDGILNASAGEACDDAGESAACNANCTLASCGDGILNASAGEACDDAGESAACNANCTPASCGDGILNASAGEACDDGDFDNSNACSNACQVNFICSAPFSTTFAGGNGWAGNMFDIVAKRNITITGIDGSFYAGAQTVEIYYRRGTYVGFENNSSAWTLLGTTTVQGQGAGVATPIPLTFSVSAAANERIAFYVTCQNSYGNGNIYTNGPAAGTLHSENNDLQFFVGIGNQYPFSGTFADRIFNGTFRYECR